MQIVNAKTRPHNVLLGNQTLYSSGDCGPVPFDTMVRIRFLLQQVVGLDWPWPCHFHVLCCVVYSVCCCWDWAIIFSMSRICFEPLWVGRKGFKPILGIRLRMFVKFWWHVSLKSQSKSPHGLSLLNGCPTTTEKKISPSGVLLFCFFSDWKQHLSAGILAFLPLAEDVPSSATITQTHWAASTIWAVCSMNKENCLRRNHFSVKAWRRVGGLRAISSCRRLAAFIECPLILTIHKDMIWTCSNTEFCKSKRFWDGPLSAVWSCKSSIQSHAFEAALSLAICILTRSAASTIWQSCWKKWSASMRQRNSSVRSWKAATGPAQGNKVNLNRSNLIMFDPLFPFQRK